MGLVWEGEQPDEDCSVWPENWQALEVFIAMGTQWRVSVGMGGAFYSGLDYAALPVVERRIGIKAADRADCFTRLRIMESEARTRLNEAQEHE